MAPQERFEGEDDALRAPVGPDELRLVLHDLSQDFTEERRAKDELPDDHVTAQAISETLDIPLAQVYDAIARVRRHDVREHVSRVLSELEEPTHRVERAAPASKDPLLTHYGYRRENVFSNILDKLPRPRKESKVEQPKSESRKSTIAEAMIIAIIGGGALLGATYLLVQFLLGR